MSKLEIKRRTRLHHPKHCSGSASEHAAMNLEFQSRTIPRRTE